ncbi:ABC transporter permease [Cutibacterium equinum]|uniref:ABC transporter permease n=1 Tax=Cutibacterium equinum TaxID=3016342 RepID=A0ABY7R1M0_9ACTN|nr:ABC transporter permease [Cutibacterium equinum]WCC80508.1 ABC transporter permease [Cutibacterium equinum]
MTLKIAINSVIKGVGSWLALIITSVVLMVVLTMSIGLIVAGASVQGEAQEAYTSMGGVALGFTVLTGLVSFRLVVSTCVGLQRQDVALWQIAGVLPRAALTIMITEIFLVTIVSALLGGLVSMALWPGYAHFVADSGLPPSDVLADPLPLVALIIAMATTSAVSLLAGIRSAKKVIKEDLVSASQSQTPPSTSVGAKIVTAVTAIVLVAGTVTLYLVIGNADRISDPKQLGDILSSYPGMGLLGCLVFAVISGPLVRALTAVLRAIPLGTSGFLSTREASARPALTRALVVPITLAAAAVGIMSSWIHELTWVTTTLAPGSGSVSAQPRQLFLLLGGPVIVACVCAAAIVFATATHRRRDNALLTVSGATTRDVIVKVVLEAAEYAVICLLCSYTIVMVNDVAMATALSAGPVGSVPVLTPGWSSAAVVAFGVILTVTMLLIITAAGMRKEPVGVILGAHS